MKGVDCRVLNDRDIDEISISLTIINKPSLFMLPPNDILKKIDKFTQKISDIIDSLMVSYDVSIQSRVDMIDVSLKSFIRSNFPDGETKIHEYEKSYTPGIAFVEDDKYEEREAGKRLKNMLYHLNAIKEEVEDHKKDFETLYKTRKTKLEAGRRESVVKEKEAGATIELLTLIRDEIKEEKKHRKKLEKEISDLRKEIKELKKYKPEEGDVIIKVTAEERKQMREKMAKDIAKSNELKKKKEQLDSWDPTI